MFEDLKDRLFGSDAERDEASDTEGVVEFEGVPIIDRYDLRYRPPDEDSGWQSLLEDIDPEAARHALHKRRTEGDLPPGTYACFPVSVATADSPPRLLEARWTLTALSLEYEDMDSGTQIPIEAVRIDPDDIVERGTRSGFGAGFDQFFDQ